MRLNLRNKDYQHTFDCEWEPYNNCTCGHDYCRCSKIINPFLADYSVIKLTESIFDSLYDTNTISGKRNATLQGYLRRCYVHR